MWRPPNSAIVVCTARAPARTNANAIAWPRPIGLAAPVTIATFPSNGPGIAITSHYFFYLLAQHTTVVILRQPPIIKLRAPSKISGGKDHGRNSRIGRNSLSFARSLGREHALVVSHNRRCAES